ncbi:tetrakisphosphate 1-kinase [Seminavis robusta]|uniref:inositol-1,3,4-trisphosphate 5/6-kinase n=1 Tax=Seminavis robusta TaxID=568900 RepID=A0A9N8HR11_9STRA|nr:tetrakisphosphate 1-kinase [Seminavis robusta]|eukprot:Sro1347_g264920.1 tetrakisphosphate 1-kinase (610) ;mRNA; r:18502-20436
MATTAKDPDMLQADDQLKRSEGEQRQEEDEKEMISSTHTLVASKWEDEMASRPILVGYAFGPKKMSTMGVVMAEASKTHLSSVSTTVLVEEDEEDELAQDDNDDEQEETQQQQQQQPTQQSEDATNTATTSASGTCISATSTTRLSPRRAEKCKGNIMMSLGSYNGGLQNIVRYLHSSCSSVDTNSTTTTMLTTGTTGVALSTGSTCGGTLASLTTQHQRLRVSFVPLDPDLPLEGQHGAKMDIVLHKLTEDILCLSKYAPLYPDLVPSLGEVNSDNCNKLQETLQQIHARDAQAAILRVHRLMQYQKKHPDCCLTDDPAKVLTLMSRSDIANALQQCLVGVQSKSGIPVASPRFLVWDPNNIANSNKQQQQPSIAESLQNANLSYPLIAKPLQAAGTKISHYMTVLLHQSSLEHIQESTCLLQEYANHDAVLYKVYVLGNNVRVYQRPSLPNLPPLFDGRTTTSTGSPSYVDFDSQRPYPRLSAFGVPEGATASSSQSQQQQQQQQQQRVAVTDEEVQPIVDKLKQAFGLELFGFDILITTTNDNDNNGANNNNKKMLVVDVNYFPSYKEMQNFPSLLAQYLTQRAIDSRRKQPPLQSPNDAHAGCLS